MGWQRMDVNYFLVTYWKVMHEMAAGRKHKKINTIAALV